MRPICSMASEYSVRESTSSGMAVPRRVKQGVGGGGPGVPADPAEADDAVAFFFFFFFLEEEVADVELLRIAAVGIGVVEASTIVSNANRSVALMGADIGLERLSSSSI